MARKLMEDQVLKNAIYFFLITIYHPYVCVYVVILMVGKNYYRFKFCHELILF